MEKPTFTIDLSIENGLQKLRLSASPSFNLTESGGSKDQEKCQYREFCEICSKKVHLYCYKCCVPTTGGIRRLPPKRVFLPINLHIILHPLEHRSKSTGLHASILCEDSSVSVHTFPEIPTCLKNDASKTLLVYPSDRSKSIKDTPNLHTMKHVVFIEGTWKQSRSIARSECIQRIPNAVSLQDYTTLFWRFQAEGSSYLSTIEAIYYFFKEYTETLHNKVENNQRLDDILFLFVHQYLKIQNYYKQSHGRTFTRRHLEGAGYIK